LNSGVTVKASGNTFTVTGTDVVTGVSSTDAEGLFGDMSAEPVIAMCLKGILPDSGTFTVKQTNPALAEFSDDPSVSQDGSTWVKEKTYTGSADKAALWCILKEGASTVTIDVTADGKTTTYTVNSNWTA
jgi:hypothetical protein